MATGETENTCPICMDNYRNPKLLPCTHTICQTCLENILASGYKSDLLVCPICRKENHVPEKGAVMFMPNYFVSTSSQELDSTCNVCEAVLSDYQKKFGRCSYCNGQMCQRCYSKHRHPENEVRHFQRMASQEDERDDGIVMDGSHRQIMHNIMAQLQGQAQSLYAGKILTSFQCEQQPGQHVQVTKILPTKDDKMWIVTGKGPFIVKHDIRGTELERKYVEGNILDIALHKDGFLLMVLENYHSIMSYEGTVISEYVSTSEHFSPRYIYMLPNGFLLVAAINENSSRDENILILFNPERCVVDTIQCHQRGVPYGSIVSLASNLKHGQICIADKMRQCIFLLREGAEPLKYTKPIHFPTRNRGGDIMDPRYRGFQPRSVTCDSKGNVFVYDNASGMIHVLSSKAKLIGVVVPNDEELSGNPYCIAIDSQDRLFVGDEKSGKVRIYEIDACYNNLGQTSVDTGAIFESMSRTLRGDAGGGGIEELVNISHEINMNPNVLLNAVLNHQPQ